MSTGEFFVEEPLETTLRPEISRIGAHEILCNDPERLRELTGLEPAGERRHRRAGFSSGTLPETLKEHFHLSSLTPLGLEDHPAARVRGRRADELSAGNPEERLEHMRTLRFAENGRTMLLDPNTRRNLELTESLRGKGKKGTLLGLLDQTATAMGGRLLRSWLEQPLVDGEKIRLRHDAVGELAENPVLSASVREELTGVYDMERLLSKVAYRSLNARDCLALCGSLKKVPGILEAADGRRSARKCARSAEELDPLADLTELLERAIHPDAPLVITEGGIIRDGYSPLLDEYREAQTSGRQWILDMEQREREETGIKNLRIQYNRVFGYYIEVTRSYLALVPDRYTRKQTLANAERYMTPELKETEQKIIGAQEQSVRLELQLFNEIRDRVSESMNRIQKTCEALKKLDVYQSLARPRWKTGYVRPEMTEDGSLRILEGRHPVVERSLPGGEFVPNDTVMDLEDNRMMIITGPNMAGKSTYMRQVALICLMAQIGCFVPAREARLAGLRPDLYPCRRFR